MIFCCRVVVVDAQTFLIPNFTYDGQAPDAHFHVGRGARVGPEVKEVEIWTRDGPRIKLVEIKSADCTDMFWANFLFNHEMLARQVKVPRSISNLQDVFACISPVNFRDVNV